MCKACKMDPLEAKRMQVRQGAVDPEDFYEETDYRKPAKTKKRDYYCPENDGKRHITAWVPLIDDLGAKIFHEYYGFWKYEEKVCVGCGKRYTRRVSDDYMQHFKLPTRPRWPRDSQEDSDQNYQTWLAKRYPHFKPSNLCGIY